ncbi:MAG: hypothetical protein HY817_00810 [Candidatus Abawacabacteria bacterium]|nr:hypothetical protein [Candidatus Abawacabacteria bacterium]
MSIRELLPESVIGEHSPDELERQRYERAFSRLPKEVVAMLRIGIRHVLGGDRSGNWFRNQEIGFTIASSTHLATITVRATGHIVATAESAAIPTITCLFGHVPPRVPRDTIVTNTISNDSREIIPCADALVKFVSQTE